jgi:hypothetical protein
MEEFSSQIGDLRNLFAGFIHQQNNQNVTMSVIVKSVPTMSAPSTSTLPAASAPSQAPVTPSRLSSHPHSHSYGPAPVQPPPASKQAPSQFKFNLVTVPIPKELPLVASHDQFRRWAQSAKDRFISIGVGSYLVSSHSGHYVHEW